MVSTVLVVTWTALLCRPADAVADHLALRNGDGLTGTVSSASKTGLIMDTELAGQVVVKWESVTGLTSQTLVRVTVTTGQIVEGTLTVSNGQLSVQRVNGSSVPVELTTTRSFDIVTAPGTMERWHGAVNGGVDISRGNSETSTLSARGTATRLGPSDRVGLFATYLFSGVGSGADAVTTARAIRGGDGTITT